MKFNLRDKLSVAEQGGKGRLLLQFIKFGMVGASNTVISLIVTYALLFLLRIPYPDDPTWTLNLATFIGFAVGVCNSYYWNNKYVFRDKRENNAKKAFVKVAISYGVTYLISMVLMDLLVEYLHIPHLLAPIPRLLFTIPLNFVMNKLWAFRDRKAPEKEKQE